MNLFFKKWLFFITLFFAWESAQAISIRSVYTAACQRQTGVIVHADQYNIKILNLEGKVKSIPRYKIIYLADYPLDQFPANGGAINLDEVDQTVVKTKVGSELETLVKGWPIGFTKDKISFLTPQGRETIIKRNSIWNIETHQLNRPLRPKKKLKSFYFSPPYAFISCPAENRIKDSIKIYPQQVLSDAIVIKRTLDEYAEGLNQIKHYKKEQRFYPVPIIHPTYNSLGLWHSFGSRHGNSGKRPNNFTPVLKNSYSSDVFDYQHIFVTGSEPMLFSVHDEAQTRSYYGFKDSYFHLSAMLDPTTILVGQNYKWKESDFDDENAQMADVFYFDMGLDFGFFSFYGTSHSLQLGVSGPGGAFEEMSIGLGGLGVVLQNHNYKFEIWSKSGERTEREFDNFQMSAKLTVSRVNLTWHTRRNLELIASLIHQKFDMTSSAMTYSGNTIIGSLRGQYELSHKYSFGGQVSYENVKADYATAGSKTFTYPKANANFTLKF